MEYPDGGSTISLRNVKKYSLCSKSRLHERIFRDFGSPVKEDEDSLPTSRSDGNLPMDTCESQENIPEPSKIISDTIITPQTDFTVAFPDKTELPDVIAKNLKLIEGKDKKTRGAIHENRKSWLRKDRPVKRKTYSKTDFIGPSKKIQLKDVSDAIKDIEFKLKEVDITTKQDVGGKPDISAKPDVNRAEKTATAPMNIETLNYPVSLFINYSKII